MQSIASRPNRGLAPTPAPAPALVEEDDDVPPPPSPRGASASGGSKRFSTAGVGPVALPLPTGMSHAGPSPLTKPPRGQLPAEPASSGPPVAARTGRRPDNLPPVNSTRQSTVSISPGPTTPQSAGLSKPSSAGFASGRLSPNPGGSSLGAASSGGFTKPANNLSAGFNGGPAVAQRPAKPPKAVRAPPVAPSATYEDADRETEAAIDTYEDPDVVEEPEAQAEVLWDYSSDTPGDLHVRAGDMVSVISSTVDGWSQCRLGANIGTVPTSYLKQF